MVWRHLPNCSYINTFTIIHRLSKSIVLRAWSPTTLRKALGQSSGRARLRCRNLQCRNLRLRLEICLRCQSNLSGLVTQFEGWLHGTIFNQDLFVKLLLWDTNFGKTKSPKMQTLVVKHAFGKTLNCSWYQSVTQKLIFSKNHFFGSFSFDCFINLKA